MTELLLSTLLERKLITFDLTTMVMSYISNSLAFYFTYVRIVFPDPAISERVLEMLQGARTYYHVEKRTDSKAAKNTRLRWFYPVLEWLTFEKPFPRLQMRHPEHSSMLFFVSNRGHLGYETNSLTLYRSMSNNAIQGKLSTCLSFPSPTAACSTVGEILHPPPLSCAITRLLCRLLSFVHEIRLSSLQTAGRMGSTAMIRQFVH